MDIQKQSAYEYNGDLVKEVIPKEVIAMVDNDLAKRRRILPIAYDSGKNILTVVTSDLFNFTDMGELTERLREATQNETLSIQLYHTSRDNFHSAYQLFYAQTAAVETEDNAVEKVVTSEQVMLVDRIIQEAIQANASDIHITPRPHDAYVQYRIAGRLHHPDIEIPKSDAALVVNVVKSKCTPPLDIANRLTPQDGAISKYGLDFRVSTYPTVFGEKVNIRIFDGGGKLKRIEDIGFQADDEALLRHISSLPSGLIVMTGPTGHGKSTTLYACISEIDPAEKVILSLEDPVEKKLPGVSQCQIHTVENHSKANMNFAKGLAATLRQNPDVILLGEIRDAETARAAVQAAKSGHLIFSTLHTQNAIQSISRMINFGIDRDTFLSEITCILAQRLLPKNCPHCAKPYEPEETVLKKLRPQDRQRLSGRVLYKGQGCAKCYHRGVLDRLPVFEFVMFNNRIRDYFMKPRGLVEAEIYLRQSRYYPYRSLWDKGLDLVAEGKTSLEELLGVINVDEDYGEGET